MVSFSPLTGEVKKTPWKNASCFLEFYLIFKELLEQAFLPRGLEKQKFNQVRRLRGDWAHRAPFDPLDQMRPFEPDQRA